MNISYRKVISEPAKLNLKMEAFKSLWKDSLNKRTTIDDGDGVKFDLYDGVIGEIPSDKQIEKIFYAYYGFKNRNEIRGRFSRENVNKGTKDKFTIRLMPTMRDCIPNSEYFDDALCDVFSNYQINTRTITGELSRDIEKRKQIIIKFFKSVEYFTDKGFDSNPDWEVLSGKDVGSIFEYDTRAIIYLSTEDEIIREHIMKYPYSSGSVVIVNNGNMLSTYNTSLDRSFETTVLKVRVTKSTDINLLSALIGNTTVTGGRWVIDFPSKLTKDKEMNDVFMKLQNICDGVMTVV